MLKYFGIFLILISFSCSKRDPKPELHDEIYSDLLSEQDIMTKAVEASEKELADMDKTAKSAVPQTGQAKSFENKYFESKNSLDRLKQQKQYFDIKVEERKQQVGLRYEESFSKNGRPWPDPKEIEIYKGKLKLYREKITWDNNKGIVKKVPRGTEKKAAPASEHGEAPAGHAEEPPAAAEHH